MTCLSTCAFPFSSRWYIPTPVCSLLCIRYSIREIKPNSKHILRNTPVIVMDTSKRHVFQVVRTEGHRCAGMYRGYSQRAGTKYAESLTRTGRRDRHEDLKTILISSLCSFLRSFPPLQLRNSHFIHNPPLQNNTYIHALMRKPVHSKDMTI